jgi:hypothetical protein
VSRPMGRLYPSPLGRGGDLSLEKPADLNRCPDENCFYPVGRCVDREG